jgi:hypothetical protein
MTFLIDLTEKRFKTPANQAVIDFIRRVNPYAHSDLGLKLIELGKAIGGTHYHCPAFSSYAYVVLHTESNVIFAIAFGMRDIAFRLPVGGVRARPRVRAVLGNRQRMALRQSVSSGRTHGRGGSSAPELVHEGLSLRHG